MKPTPVVQALSRGLTLLELLASSEDGLTLGDVAARAGLQPTTAHNLLRTLASHGCVERAERPVRYRPGPAVAELARRWSERAALRWFESELAGLAGRHPQAVFVLAEARGGEVVTALRVGPDTRGRVERPRGATLGLYATASGLAMLAFAGAEPAAELAARAPFWEAGARLWKQPSRLQQALAASRRRGWVEVQFEPDRVWKVAAPLVTDGVPAALGGSLRADGLTAAGRTRFARDLRAAAGRLSTGRTGGQAC